MKKSSKRLIETFEKGHFEPITDDSFILLYDTFRRFPIYFVILWSKMKTKI